MVILYPIMVPRIVPRIGILIYGLWKHESINKSSVTKSGDQNSCIRSIRSEPDTKHLGNGIVGTYFWFSLSKRETVVTKFVTYY